MGVRWKPFGSQLIWFIVLIVVLKYPKCQSLNPEGLALLKFREGVESDPYGALANWNPNDLNPCLWLGVLCVESKVQILDLKGLSLKGILVPELGKLSHLRSLVLYKNHFSGTIPKEIGSLSMLERLDLRDNDLSGTVPADIGRMHSLKCLLLGNNYFEGQIPMEFWKLNLLSTLQCDGNLSLSQTTGIGCINRKFGHCLWQNRLKQIDKADSFINTARANINYYLKALTMFKFAKFFLHGHEQKSCYARAGSPELHMFQTVPNPTKFVRRRLLEKQSFNLEAHSPNGGAPSGQIISHVFSRSSGAIPASPNGKKKRHHTPAPPPLASAGPLKPDPKIQPSETRGHKTSGNIWKYLIPVISVVFLLSASVAAFIICQARGVTPVGPWKTGLSGQLQKAFVTGVPKLNRSELETACEDFSNIIDTLDDCTIYKGTLSSGVEIAVASTAVTAFKDWSKRKEMAYRRKVDSLSRINHKNFVNLIGFCEEDEPFNRMMVFEYAPNGTLFEHLHVKEIEHLDWSARTRIIMGIAYCLQYMHHDLNPPVSHTNLNSSAIYLTDDYAAKVAEISFSAEPSLKPKISGDGELGSDLEANVYSFGILLLEIISGKLPHSEEQGSLVNWAAEYLSNKRSISYMIDPSLKSFKNNELDVICEVIQESIQQDPKRRPTMKEIISKLREVIAISPDAATPKLSPLWWAELEILSVEAN